jgi:uncharacterized phage protein (TIGR01671 family)
MKQREIKFRRAYFDYKTKAFIQFCYWGPVDSGFYSPASISNADKDLEIDQQFTGLFDKNGKKIYEGDIFRYEMLRAEVGTDSRDTIEYIEEVHFQDGSFDLDGCPVYVANEIGEVIGNVFENPKLLKP